MTKAKPKQPAKANISHCTFIGVQFDAKAVSAIETIAAGLVENAKALGALALVLKASNVEVQAMLRIAANAEISGERSDSDGLPG